MNDITKSMLGPKENWELASELLDRFPKVDHSKVLNEMVSLCFYWMRWGNKREERMACDLLNELQRILVRNQEKK